MPLPRPPTGVDPLKVYDPTAQKQAFTPIVHPKSGLERGTLVNVLKDDYLFKHLDDREMDVIGREDEDKGAYCSTDPGLFLLAAEIRRDRAVWLIQFDVVCSSSANKRCCT